MSKRIGFWRWLYLLTKGAIKNFPNLVKDPATEIVLGFMGAIWALVFTVTYPFAWLLAPIFSLISIHGVYRTNLY
jgi:hypothetical protein